jgi:DNA-binding GntR family transcriptional regulator
MSWLLKVFQTGKRTFVIDDFFTLSCDFKHDAKKINPRVDLVSLVSATASKEEAEKLQIREGAAVWRIINRLSLDDYCVMVDHITLDKKRFKNLTRTDFIQRRGSILYQLYQMKYGQTVVRSSERLRAGLAGKQYSEWLEPEAKYPGSYHLEESRFGCRMSHWSGVFQCSIPIGTNISVS